MAHNVALETFAERIAQQLKDRGFCFVFEDELERCWPTSEMSPAERERQIQAFAESRGWSASIHDSDSGRTRAVFRQ